MKIYFYKKRRILDCKSKGDFIFNKNRKKKMFIFFSLGVSSWILFSIIITLILLIIPFLGISKKERETYVGELGRLNPFECGFNSIFKSFSGLCVQFLNIAILFLLVDLEIALLIPFFFSVFIIEKMARIIILLISFIIIFLFFLLLIEIAFGGLNWKEDL